MIYTLLNKFEIEVLWLTGHSDIKGMMISPPPDSKGNFQEGKVCIGINPLLGLKERVITFFHEILHYDLEKEKGFIDSHGGRIPEAEQKLEDEVDRIAYSIYDTQPRLVEYLISKYHLNDAGFGRRF